MSRRRSRESPTPEITPLIDVVFLLLIFFMVSTVFKKEELALLLSLPTSEYGSDSETQAKKFLTIELTKEGLAVNGNRSSIDDLANEVKNVKDKNIPVDLRVDESVPYARLVKVLDVLKKFELGNLSLITKKTK